MPLHGLLRRALATSVRPTAELSPHPRRGQSRCGVNPANGRAVAARSLPRRSLRRQFGHRCLRPAGATSRTSPWPWPRFRTASIRPNATMFIRPLTVTDEISIRELALGPGGAKIGASPGPSWPPRPSLWLDQAAIPLFSRRVPIKTLEPKPRTRRPYWCGLTASIYLRPLSLIGEMSPSPLDMHTAFCLHATHSGVGAPVHSFARSSNSSP
jgi:hypothetical protein